MPVAFIPDAARSGTRTRVIGEAYLPDVAEFINEKIQIGDAATYIRLRAEEFCAQFGIQRRRNAAPDNAAGRLRLFILEHGAGRSESLIDPCRRIRLHLHIAARVRAGHGIPGEGRFNVDQRGQKVNGIDRTTVNFEIVFEPQAFPFRQKGVYQELLLGLRFARIAIVNVGTDTNSGLLIEVQFDRRAGHRQRLVRQDQRSRCGEHKGDGSKADTGGSASLLLHRFPLLEGPAVAVRDSGARAAHNRFGQFFCDAPRVELKLDRGPRLGRTLRPRPDLARLRSWVQWGLVAALLLALAIGGGSLGAQPAPDSAPPDEGADVIVPTTAPETTEADEPTVDEPVQNQPAVDSPPVAEPQDAPDSWRFLYRPRIAAGLQGATERGGARSEGRAQDHGIAAIFPGAEAAAALESWSLGARVIGRITQDYLRNSSDERGWEASYGWSEAFVFLRRDFDGSQLPGGREERGARPESTRAETLAPVARPLLADVQAGRPPEALSLSLGRQRFLSDPEGWLYHGDANGGVLNLALFRSPMWGLSVAAWTMDREDRIPGLDPARRNYAAFYTGVLGLYWKNASIALLYGYYRSPGQAAVADWVLPGALNERIVIPSGQSALPDYDVHYYGIRIQRSARVVTFRLAGYYNHGREIAVDTAGVRVAASRKSIRGALGYASVLFHLGLRQESRGCESLRPENLICTRAYSIERGPEIEIAGLATTRDRNDSDDDLRGFGALRPLPSVMGGAASILLTGPAPELQRAPLRNVQPGAILAPNPGQSRFERPKSSIRDNNDPAPPDYENEGLILGSLRFGMAPGGDVAADLYANYGEFLGGRAVEGILALNWPLDLGDARATVTLAGAGARFRLEAPVADPLTGLARRADNRFYSRYLLGLTVRY